MKSYSTTVKIKDPKKVVLDLPFLKGDEVEITVSKRDSYDLLASWEKNFKETQSLPAVIKLTEREIVQEIVKVRKEG